MPLVGAALLSALPASARDHGSLTGDRRLEPSLRPGALVRDHGLVVRAPRRGRFVWGELKYADGSWQELLVETSRDGRVFLTHKGDERAALRATRRRGPSPDPDVTTLATETSAGQCQDDYHDSYPWVTPHLDWRFNPAGTPSHLLDSDGGTTAVVAAIERAQRNITDANNWCGRPDGVSATGSHLGTTSRAVGLTTDGSCTGADGHAVIGFGALPSSSIGRTCAYGIVDGVSSESDILINDIPSVASRWTLSLSDCSGRRLLLTALMTHEFGHVYGLAHASTDDHPTLTMQPVVAHCSRTHNNLALGDMLGLERKYPSP